MKNLPGLTDINDEKEFEKYLAKLPLTYTAQEAKIARHAWDAALAVVTGELAKLLNEELKKGKDK